MANSVSNDALWEKLSEINEQLNSSKQTENTSDFSGVKDEIIAEIGKQASLLGKNNDINFGANEQNWKTTDENITKILNIVSRIRKQQRETTEQQVKSDTEKRLDVSGTPAKDNRKYFNFRFFKFRKTSVVITVLGLLVLTLTLFCMKQQNDYTLLNNEYYRQSIGIRTIQAEIDNLRNSIKPNARIKK